MWGKIFLREGLVPGQSRVSKKRYYIELLGEEVRLYVVFPGRIVSIIRDTIFRQSHLI